MFFRKIYSKILIVILVVFSICTYLNYFSFKVNAESQDESIKDISELSIEELTNQIIDYELNYIYFFSNSITGIEKFKSNNEYYNELINREEAYNYIIDMYENSTADNQSKLALLIDILDDDYSKYSISNEINNRDNIYAPNGTAIQFAIYGLNHINNPSYYHNSVVNSFPSLENSCISPANDAYNCHSYAWYMQNASTNHYWIRYPDSYLLDDSYVEVDEVREGDIICYYALGYNYSQGYETYSLYISHSAIVVSENGFDIEDNDTLVNVNLVSKWGTCGVYEHNGDECPYGTLDDEFQFVKAYRPRTTTAVSLPIYPVSNDPMNINGNGTILQKYKMYELDVTSGYYEFSVSSSNQLDVRLYDLHMQLVSINQVINGTYTNSFIKHLDSGIYYLRVAYQDTSESGNITTSIINHTHTFYYSNGNDICSGCGYTKTHSHSYDDHYQWTSLTNHRSYCSCGNYINSAHIVSPDAFQNGLPTAPCLLCNGFASIAGTWHDGIGNYPYTLNGSFILPNGVIILVDEDLEAYLNGTLIFINPNENIDRGNRIIPFIMRKEESGELIKR